MGFSKSFLVIVNVCFLITGIALLTVGAIVLKDFNSEGLEDVLSEWRAPPITTIIVGCLIILASGLGFMAARSGKPMMLMLYSAVLIAILIIQLIVGIYTLAKWYNGEDKYFLIPLEEQFHPGTPSSDQLFNNLQRELECCGVVSYRDYINAGFPVPASCCVTQSLLCTSDGLSSGPFYRVGCAWKLQEYLYESGKIIGGVTIGLGIFEIIAVGAAFAFMKKSKYHV